MYHMEMQLVAERMFAKNIYAVTQFSTYCGIQYPNSSREQAWLSLQFKDLFYRLNASGGIFQSMPMARILK